jgi:DNA-directed RNA polymerase I subunit RPA34.5
MAIPAKPFAPPQGFEKVHLLATDYPSPAFLSERGEKQLWYFTAPSSVSIESLGSLDMEAVLHGQPIVHQGDASYHFVPVERTTETLLLAEGQEVKYVPKPVKISQIFHLQHTSTPKIGSNPLSTSIPATLNFAATAPGEMKPVRPQPEGLRMRYQPFGSGHCSGQPSTQPSGDSTASLKPYEVPNERTPNTSRQTKKQKGTTKQAADELDVGEVSPATSRKLKSDIVKDVVAKTPRAASLAFSQSRGIKEKNKRSKLVDEVI